MSSLTLSLTAALLLLSGLGSSFADTSGMDLLVDEVIEELTNQLNTSGKSQLSFPDVSGQVSKKIGLVKLKASFLGQGGWLKDLSTIKRTAASSVTDTSTGMDVELSMGLDELAFGFGRFRINLSGMKLHGEMNGQVKQNSVNIRLSVNTSDDSCHTVINSLEITQLSGIEVKISGHNKVADWIYNGITKIVINDFSNKIKDALSNAIQENLSKVLTKNDVICQSLM